MPKGPQGQKRPADTIGCAVMVGRIATGEITEVLKEPSGKVRSGQAGAAARANKLTGGGTLGHRQEGSGTALEMTHG